MKSEDNIKKRFQKAAAHTNPKIDKAVLEDVLSVYKKSLKFESSGSEPGIWIKIMKSRLTHIAAAAIILTGIFIGAKMILPAGDDAGPMIAEKTETSQEVILDKRSNEAESEREEPLEKALAAETAATLEAELKDVEAMYAVGDVLGLVEMVAKGEWDSKVVAVDYLSAIGDVEAIEALEALVNSTEEAEVVELAHDTIAAIEERLNPAVDAAFYDSVVTGTDLGILVLDKESKQPIADAELRVYYCDEEDCNTVYFPTNVDGFSLLEFDVNGPRYLSIIVTKGGYVPMMFAWRDERVENLGETFSFYMPKGKTIGGIIENEDSNAVASATVSISMYSDESREETWMTIRDHEVVTDPNGRWTCDVFPEEPKSFSVRLSHDDYADTQISINDRQYQYENFYNKQSVLVIKEGVLLEGWVTDIDGKPIEGAEVFTGEDRFDEVPETETDSEGYFAFENFLPDRYSDKIVLTVKAEGYGPGLEVFPKSEGIEPVVISLDGGRTIRGRVVDLEGNPIFEAGVNVERWRGYRSLSWQSETDEDGRFVWNEAPGDEVLIDVHKAEYMRVSEHKCIAGEEEYEFVMHPPLVISGHVVDVDTNEPIQRFTMSPGIQWDSGQISWERDSYSSKVFTEGEYSFTRGHPYPGHLIQIEAEGYLPTSSRVFDSYEGSVTYDFSLQKGTGPGGLVYEPNGSPAGGAEIYVVTANQSLYFENGKPSGSLDNTEWTTTNNDGTFSFQGFLEEPVYKLVVIHEAGFADVEK
ncbi:MAG: hypothetical protein ACYSUK_11430, partial [Planctomycetota bacterium]